MKITSYIPKKKIPFYKNKKFLVSLIGIGIIILMVGSVLNMFQETAESYKYNDYKFVKTENGWATYIKGSYIYLNYGPKEVEDIMIPNFNIDTKIYVLFNPDERKEQDYIIQRLLSILRSLDIIAFTACTKEKNCSNIPIIDCNNQNFIFYFKNANETKAYIEKNCLVLQGTKEEQLKLVDRLTYKLFGVMG